MGTEYFFGITLDSTNKEFKWEPDELIEENGSSGNVTFTPKGEHCLVLKQALLTGGTEGEKNIVEVQTAGYKSEVKIPIAALVGGKTTQISMDISLPDPPATIRLIEGSGPVHIAGIHAIQTDQFNEDDEDEDEDFLDEMDEEDEDEEVEAEESKAKGKDVKEGKGKKRTNSGSGPVASKKRKNGKEAAA